jgi:hypothetical protein
VWPSRRTPKCRGWFANYDIVKGFKNPAAPAVAREAEEEWN